MDRMVRGSSSLLGRIGKAPLRRGFPRCCAWRRCVRAEDAFRPRATTREDRWCVPWRTLVPPRYPRRDAVDGRRPGASRPWGHRHQWSRRAVTRNLPRTGTRAAQLWRSSRAGHPWQTVGCSPLWWSLSSGSDCRQPHWPLVLWVPQGAQGCWSRPSGCGVAHVQRVSRNRSAVRQPRSTGARTSAPPASSTALGANSAHHGRPLRVLKRVWHCVRPRSRWREGRPHGRWTVIAVHAGTAWVALAGQLHARRRLPDGRGAQAPRASRSASTRRPAATASGPPPVPGRAGDGHRLTRQARPTIRSPAASLNLSHPRVPDVWTAAATWCRQPAGSPWLRATNPRPRGGRASSVASSGAAALTPPPTAPPLSGAAASTDFAALWRAGTRATPPCRTPTAARRAARRLTAASSAVDLVGAPGHPRSPCRSLRSPGVTGLDDVVAVRRRSSPARWGWRSAGPRRFPGWSRQRPWAGASGRSSTRSRSRRSSRGVPASSDRRTTGLGAPAVGTPVSRCEPSAGPRLTPRSRPPSKGVGKPGHVKRTRGQAAVGEDGNPTLRAADAVSRDPLAGERPALGSAGRGWC